MKRRILLVLGVVALALVCGPILAAERASEKAGPKVDGSTGNLGAVKPLPQVTKLSRQYKEIRERQQRLVETFRNVHGVLGQGGDAGAALSQEEACLPIVRSVLGTFQMFLAGQDDKGNGDIDYWIRTRSLLSRQGNLVVTGMNTLLQQCGGAMNPLLRSAIKNISDNLRQGMGKYDNGYGNLDYWVAASGNTRDSIWQASANLSELLGALPAISEADTMVMVKAQLGAIRDLLAGQADKGHGTIDYWIRTRSHLARQGNLGVRLFNDLLALHGAKMQGLLRTAIQNVSDNLRQAMAKYDNGYGDLDYWVSASGSTRDALLGAARNLTEVLNSI